MASGRGGGDHFPSFRRHSERSDIDPFQHMRDQFVRDPEGFFHDNHSPGPRAGWQGMDPSGQPGMFRHHRGPPPFDGFGDAFSGGFRPPRSRFADFDDEEDELDGFRRPFQRMHPQQPSSQQQQAHSPHNSNEMPHRYEEQTIPIRVIHEPVVTDGKPSKHRYSVGGRNTTELPAKSSSPGQESPRLERAHSEPPKSFAQRIHQAKKPTAYTTIPENLETPSAAAAGGGPDPNPIKNSASDPSVPQGSATSGAPVPPPRKSPSRDRMNDASSSGPAVRHIPIFVEGRDEPVNRRPNQGEPKSAFRKPSEYYPAGVKRIPSQDGKGPEAAVRQISNIEPSSPMGPPEGPIPMGCSPQFLSQPQAGPVEPTSPLSPPEGPIPMPYNPKTPDVVDQPTPPPLTKKSPSPPKQPEPQIPPKEDAPTAAKSIDERKQSVPTKEEGGRKTSSGVRTIPIKVHHTTRSNEQQPPRPKNSTADKPEETKAQQPQQQKTQQQSKPQQRPEEAPKPQDPTLAKLDKIKEDVRVLLEKIENFKGSKTDKEYLYLDEMLTRHLLALDCIETEGRDDIRQLRKDSIRSINRCLSMLDSRAKGADEPAVNDQILSELAAESSASSEKTDETPAAGKDEEAKKKETSKAETEQATKAAKAGEEVAAEQEKKKDEKKK